jgi:hypothetical protein
MKIVLDYLFNWGALQKLNELEWKIDSSLGRLSSDLNLTQA